MESAVALALLFALPLILTSGLFSNANNMGLWILIPPIRYGFDMLTRSQLYDMPVELNTPRHSVTKRSAIGSAVVARSAS